MEGGLGLRLQIDLLINFVKLLIAMISTKTFR